MGFFETKYGVKIKNAKNPTSACLAISRQVIENIRFEGKGKEALLEILVKASNNQENVVPVKEIPIKEYDGIISRNLNFDRVLNYTRDVWELYKHGKKSKLEIERDTRILKIITSYIVFQNPLCDFIVTGIYNIVLISLQFIQVLLIQISN